MMLNGAGPVIGARPAATPRPIRQAALTDAAFSDHERAARLSGAGPAHGAQQLIELGLPANQDRRRTHSFTPLSTHRALVWLITTRASTDVPALPGGHHCWQGEVEGRINQGR